MPTVQKLIEAGLTVADLQAFGRGEHGAKVRMNAVLHKLGLNDHEIAQFIGKHNMVPQHEIETYQKFMGWMQEPTQMDSGPALPGQSVSMESMLPPSKDDQNPPGEELTFNSLAARPRKPRRPDTIHPGLSHDGHTKKLTPERMIENLMHHGTVFNMANDGLDVSNADFDPELAEALGINNADDLDVDDMLEVDIGQPDTFEEEWKAWKEMRGQDDFPDDIPPPPDTVRAIPTPKAPPPEDSDPEMWEDTDYSSKLKGFSDLSLQDITDADDDTLYVTDQEPLEDFEDEVSRTVFR
jgi:hypothetical protein